MQVLTLAILVIFDWKPWFAGTGRVASGTVRTLGMVGPTYGTRVYW